MRLPGSIINSPQRRDIDDNDLVLKNPSQEVQDLLNRIIESGEFEPFEMWGETWVVTHRDIVPWKYGCDVTYRLLQVVSAADQDPV